MNAICGAGKVQFFGHDDEMLEMTQALVDAANRGSPIEFVQLARGQIGRDTLQGSALAQAMLGRTTIDEAMRVSAQLEA